MENERRRVYARFLLLFVFSGFLMKIVSELVHEVGHAFTVLMLGGEILGINIRAEWPFTLSHTKWVIPNPTNTNLAMVAVAGILLEILVSILGQSILFLRKNMRPLYAVPIFWLSFWTYLSPVVYLVMGALHPFGDILDLINVIPVPRFLVGFIGVTMMVPCAYFLSLILRNIFLNIMDLSMASDMVSYFWALLYTFYIFVTMITYGLPVPPTTTVAFLLVVFIWSYISSKWVLVYISEFRRKEGVKPVKYDKPLTGNSDSLKDPGRKLKLAYTVIFLAAAVSALLTMYMVSQYLGTYSVVIKTGIEIEVVSVDINSKEPSINLSVTVDNPTSKNITLDRIEFEVSLNNKYMKNHVFNSIPLATPGSNVNFIRVIDLPEDRMFTIEEARRYDSWEWTVAGSGHVVTMFGETLLRFKSKSICEPKVN